MTRGTKSLLFGVHQFLWHPLTVAVAWRRLYGKWPTPKEALAVFVHDWGYWGCETMDGVDGAQHPWRGWLILLRMPGDWSEVAHTCLYHSRHLARNHGVEPSLLCWADKASILYDPWFLYLPRAWLSGELGEYRALTKAHGIDENYSHRDWYRWVRTHFENLARTRDGAAAPYTHRN